MTPTTNTAALIVLVVLAGLGAIVAFRSGARGAYKVAKQTEQVTRMSGHLTRSLGTGAVIVAIQWAVVALSTDPRAWGVALGVPAVFAGTAIARMFSVTELTHPQHAHKGGRR
ncbi:MAG: hypothetical protein ACRDSR_12950 [Pseudonocardiaceae bacterium]